MSHIHKEELCDLLRSPSTIKRVNCQKVTMGLGCWQNGEKKECIPNASRKSLENVYIEQQEACEWTTLRHILGRYILKIGSGRISLLPCPLGDWLNFGFCCYNPQLYIFN